MKNKTILSSVLAATMMLATFTGCGSNNQDAFDTQATDIQSSEENVVANESAEMPGFDADAVIGVTLPWLGTQNWVEAKEMFAEELAKEGYKPLVEAADQTVTLQQQQIKSMIEAGAKAIVIGPVDSAQLADVIDEAKASGIYIIGYDRLLESTAGVDGVVQYGSIETGKLQAEALVQGLKEKKGNSPYNIELFGGGHADPNSPNFFNGAMEVLQPLVDDGTIVIESGETDFIQCATADWNNAKAQARMEKLLSTYYTDKEIDGVLCPNDGIARACITACENAGQETPVVSGLDAENDSVQWIWQGRQYSTISKPTDKLVKRTIEVINSLRDGKGLPDTDVKVENGVKEVPVYELTPIVVTKENEKEVFANDPLRMELLQD